MSQGRRSEPLPPDWPHIRQAVLQRDGHQCRWTLPDGTRCPAPADEVDHTTPAHLGGTDHPANLQSLCRPHHLSKTGRDANPATRRRRPTEAHPGQIGD